MWLNEGFTVFEERKVSAILYGEDYSKIEAQLGNVDLWNDMNSFLGVQDSYASLYPDLKDGASPDDSFSEVPYEKGFQFLAYLETLFPSPTDFQDLVRTYILKNSLKSVVWQDWQAAIIDYTNNKYDSTVSEGIQRKIDWNAWIYSPGANPSGVILDFSTEESKSFENLADEYISLKGDSSPADFQMYLDTKNPNLKVIFLNRLTARTSEVTKKLLTKIDTDLKCT